MPLCPSVPQDMRTIWQDWWFPWHPDSPTAEQTVAASSLVSWTGWFSLSLPPLADLSLRELPLPLELIYTWYILLQHFL